MKSQQASAASSSSGADTKPSRGVWTTCSFLFVLVSLVIVIQSSSSSASSSGGQKGVSSSSWKVHKKSVLTALHDEIQALEAENKELRAVVYHLVRKQQNAQGDPEKDEEEASLKYHVEQFEARQRQLQDDRTPKSALDESRLRMEGLHNSIRLGNATDDESTSSISGDNQEIRVRNPNKINLHADNIRMGRGHSDDPQHLMDNVSLSSGDGERSEIIVADNRAGFRSSGSTVQLKGGLAPVEFNGDSIPPWSGIVYNRSRVGFYESNPHSPVTFGSGDGSFMALEAASDGPGDGHFALHHSNSKGDQQSAFIGTNKGNAGRLQFKAGQARWTVQEDKEPDGPDFDYDHLFGLHIQSDSEAKISMGEGEWKDPETDITYYHAPSMHIDSGSEGSTVFAAGKASLSTASRTYASDISNSSDFSRHDIVWEALPYDSETFSALHFQSGSSRVSIHNRLDDEFDDGAEVSASAGGDLHLLGGMSTSQGDPPGSVHVNPGKDLDEEDDPKAGNVHLGGGEGFSGIFTATLSVNFTHLEDAQGMRADIYAANVSLIDVIEDRCGVPLYTQCNRHDMLFVNSPDAVMAGEIIDETACLAYIWAKPYRKEWWEDDDWEHVSMVNFLIVQRLNAEVDHSPAECDEDMLFD
eukprot:gb/GECG01000947.1/.p1 GENE.gb/GECG01000947.1/~~gb/GECG01000947.1/.p1  ORF type:complete len:642 (+),score=107.16 gb/GECG01000947.1/:1-1926(+)